MSSQTEESTKVASAAEQMDDAEVARRISAVEQLTSVFGFDQEAATQAVNAVGPLDLTRCYNYILDQGLGQDHGGPVNPISHCPHLERHVRLGLEDLPTKPHLLPCSSTVSENSGVGGLKAEVTDEGTCPSTENWMCLECGVIRCGRYSNGHGLAHWKDTQGPDEEGHCVAVSLMDLSVWCHICNSYCLHPTHLDPLVKRLEKLKFEDDEANSTSSDAITSSQQPIRTAADIPGSSGHEPDRKKARLPSSPGNESETASRSTDLAARENNDEAQEDEDETSHTEGSGTIEVSIDDMSEDALMRLLSSISAARGIPLQFLMHTVGLESQDDEDEDLEYPFESPPRSMKDVADFILSEKCRKILILTGAGISVCSGIPDYRSADGFYATMNVEAITASPAEREAIRLDPTVALQQNLFLENPLPCLELKRDFILGTAEQRWKATLAHRFQELLHCQTGKLARVYTMNIDGLQDQCTDLPRDKTIAVHGSMDRAECAKCGTEADFDEFCDKVREQIKDVTGRDESAPAESKPIDCENCGASSMKPAIVLFRSSLPPTFFNNVPIDTEDVDLLLVMGTSLQVAPANSLVWRVPKTCMRVLINREPVGHHLGIRYGDESKRDYFGVGDCEDVILDLLEHLGWLTELETLLSEEKLPEMSAVKLRARLSSKSEE